MVPGICSNEHFLGPFLTDYALCIWHQLRAGCNAWTRATIVASSRLQVFYRFSTLKKAANMNIVVCHICGKCLDFGGGTSFLSKRACLHSSGPAKHARMEIKVEMISGMVAATLHTACRKDYSRPTTIKKTQEILKQVRPEVRALLSPGSSLRSSPPDLRLHPTLLIFCGKLAVE